jgi:hypothetical protein
MWPKGEQVPRTHLFDTYLGCRSLWTFTYTISLIRLEIADLQHGVRRTLIAIATMSLNASANARHCTIQFTRDRDATAIFATGC